MIPKNYLININKSTSPKPIILLGIVKTIFLLVLFLVSLDSIFAMEVAISVDDLPVHGDLLPRVNRLDIVKKMLSALDKHKLKNVYGFINAGQLNNNMDHYNVLKRWVDDGQLLGNHTYNHANLDKMSAARFIKEIQLNEPYLKKLMRNKDYHYFRYPYLYEGNTQEKRDKVRHYLFTHDYKIAQVTMDFQDYLWNNAYVRCVKKQDKHAIEWLKKSYIEQSINSIIVAHILAKSTLNRDIKNILLLHIGIFDALMLDDLLTAYERKGIKFISLSEALQDKAYTINPNTVSESPGGFLEQLAHSKKTHVPKIVKKLMDNIPQKQLHDLCLR